MIAAWLSAAWGRLAAYGAAMAAGAGLLAGIWLSGRRQGRQEAARDALGRDLENRKVRDAVDRDVQRRPDPAADLLRDWRRD